MFFVALNWCMMFFAAVVSLVIFWIFDILLFVELYNSWKSWLVRNSLEWNWNTYYIITDIIWTMHRINKHIHFAQHLDLTTTINTTTTNQSEPTTNYILFTSQTWNFIKLSRCRDKSRTLVQTKRGFDSINAERRLLNKRTQWPTHVAA